MFKDGYITPTQVDNYLSQISKQITNISPSNIDSKLYITQPPPKQVIDTNKKRISDEPKPKPIMDMRMAIKNMDLSSFPFGAIVTPQNNMTLSSPDYDNNDNDHKEEKVDTETLQSQNDGVMNMKQVQFEDLSAKKQCKELYFKISESVTNANKYILPVPNGNYHRYPIELYNDIKFDTDNYIQNDYNTNNLISIDTPIYPNDVIKEPSLTDFIDRKFHLRPEIVKKWINDRAYLMDKLKQNDDGKDDDEEDMESWMDIKYRKFAIIDVRCHDFIGGNIPYCYNINYEIFEEIIISDLLTKFEYESDVVIHCMYSQHRGPRAAFWYWKQRRKWEEKYKHKLPNKQRVWVLDGGFKQWLSDNILDSDLVTNYDSKYWDDEYFPLTGREFFYRNDWRPDNQ